MAVDIPRRGTPALCRPAERSRAMPLTMTQEGRYRISGMFQKKKEPEGERVKGATMASINRTTKERRSKSANPRSCEPVDRSTPASTRAIAKAFSTSSHRTESNLSTVDPSLPPFNFDGIANEGGAIAYPRESRSRRSRLLSTSYPAIQATGAPGRGGFNFLGEPGLQYQSNTRG